MHALLLIWEQSRYYNTSSRLVPLLQLIADSLVTQTCIFMKGNFLTHACLQCLPHSAYDMSKVFSNCLEEACSRRESSLGVIICG